MRDRERLAMGYGLWAKSWLITGCNAAGNVQAKSKKQKGKKEKHWTHPRVRRRALYGIACLLSLPLPRITASFIPVPTQNVPSDDKRVQKHHLAILYSISLPSDVLSCFLQCSAAACSALNIRTRTRSYICRYLIGCRLNRREP